MPEMATCPVCQQQVPLPEEGRTVACPACGELFVAAPLSQAPDRDSPAESPSEQFTPGPAPRHGQDGPEWQADLRVADDTGWRSLHAGLRVQTWSQVVSLLGLSLFGLAALVMLSGPGASLGQRDGPFGRNAGLIPGTLFSLAALAWVAGLVLALVAGSFFVLTPDRRHTRGLGVAAVVWSGLALTEVLGFLYWHSGPEYEIVPLIWFRVILVLAVEGTRLTLLACLLRSVIRALGLTHLSAVSRTLVILTPCLLFGGEALGAVLVWAGPHVEALAIASLFNVVGFDVVVVLGIVVMLQLITALHRQAQDGRAEGDRGAADALTLRPRDVTGP